MIEIWFKKNSYHTFSSNTLLHTFFWLKNTQRSRQVDAQATKINGAGISIQISSEYLYNCMHIWRNGMLVRGKHITITTGTHWVSAKSGR